MGLDMYLTKRHYVKNWNHEPEKYEIEVRKAGKPVPYIDTTKICTIEEDVMYWRKFNALHNWFVENCQEGTDDCTEYYVSREDLKELLEKLNLVLANKDKAADELPTVEGFFFGSTDYDETYFADIQDTVEVLEKELAKDDGADYYYNSSW